MFAHQKTVVIKRGLKDSGKIKMRVWIKGQLSTLYAVHGIVEQRCGKLQGYANGQFSTDVHSTRSWVFNKGRKLNLGVSITSHIALACMYSNKV